MFLSWGAEEYSLCGSREFVEEYEMEVAERWVTTVTGGSFITTINQRCGLHQHRRLHVWAHPRASGLAYPDGHPGPRHQGHLQSRGRDSELL